MSAFINSKKFTGVSHKVLANDDKSYYITYKLGGKFHRVHIGKYSEGIREEYCHQKRNEAINNEKFGDGAPVVKHKRKNVVTVNQLADVYFIDKAAENKENHRQRGKYNLHIKPALGNEDVMTLSRDDILKFRNSLSADKAPKTVNGIIQLLTAIINYSIKYKDLNLVNPCSKVQRLKVDDDRERFLTLEEVHFLKQQVAHERPLHLFVLLSLITGGRLETILNIQKKDIDLKHNTITLKDLKNGSTYKGFLDKETKEVLTGYMPSLEPNHFIVGGKKQKMPTRTIQRHLLRILDELFNEGLEKRDSKNRVVIHTLRHTFASQLAIAGTPILTIQKLMNHSDIQQTMRYAKLAPDSGKEHIQKLYI